MASKKDRRAEERKKAFRKGVGAFEGFNEAATGASLAANSLGQSMFQGARRKARKTMYSKSRAAEDAFGRGAHHTSGIGLSAYSRGEKWARRRASGVRRAAASAKVRAEDLRYIVSNEYKAINVRDIFSRLRTKLASIDFSMVNAVFNYIIDSVKKLLSGIRLSRPPSGTRGVAEEILGEGVRVPPELPSGPRSPPTGDFIGNPIKQEELNRLRNAGPLEKPTRSYEQISWAVNILDISRDVERYKSRYVALSRIFHPDKCKREGLPEKKCNRYFRAVQEAYEIIRDNLEQAKEMFPPQETPDATVDLMIHEVDKILSGDKLDGIVVHLGDKRSISTPSVTPKTADLIERLQALDRAPVAKLPNYDGVDSELVRRWKAVRLGNSNTNIVPKTEDMELLGLGLNANQAKHRQKAQERSSPASSSGYTLLLQESRKSNSQGERSNSGYKPPTGDSTRRRRLSAERRDELNLMGLGLNANQAKHRLEAQQRSSPASSSGHTLLLQASRKSNSQGERNNSGYKPPTGDSTRRRRRLAERQEREKLAQEKFNRAGKEAEAILAARKARAGVRAKNISKADDTPSGPRPQNRQVVEKQRTASIDKKKLFEDLDKGEFQEFMKPDFRTNLAAYASRNAALRRGAKPPPPENNARNVWSRSSTSERKSHSSSESKPHSASNFVWDNSAVAALGRGHSQTYGFNRIVAKDVLQQPKKSIVGMKRLSVNPNAAPALSYFSPPPSPPSPPSPPAPPARSKELTSSPSSVRSNGQKYRNRKIRSLRQSQFKYKRDKAHNQAYGPRTKKSAERFLSMKIRRIKKLANKKGMDLEKYTPSLNRKPANKMISSLPEGEVQYKRNK
jgi:hypothetical protein